MNTVKNNRYPEHIMQTLRKRLGLIHRNDTSRDSEINAYSPNEAFEKMCNWVGAGFADIIKGWIKDIYGIDLNEDLEKARQYEENIKLLCMTENNINKFAKYLRQVKCDDWEKLSDFSSLIYKNVNPIITEEFANAVRKLFPSIEVVEGGKVHRLVNNICRYLGIDKEENYKKMFSDYADYITLPLIQKDIFGITINTGVWKTDSTYDRQQ